MANRTQIADGTRLAALLGPVVASAGYEIEQVAVTTVGRRSVVRVVVDADGGASLDGIAVVSSAVSDALEAAGYPWSAATSSYTLEVSSPGVDRLLTQPRHWRRNVGRLVRTRVDDAGVEGRVVSADDDGVVLDVDGTSRTLAYDRLGPGSVQVEFAHPEGGDR